MQKALDILNKGVDSLSFHVKAKELNAEYIETLLSDIQAECVELNFSTCQGHVVELANLLVAYFQKKDYDVKKLKGSINYDFFNKMLTRGKEKGDMVQTAKSLIEAIQPLPFYRVLNVNALSLNNAGAYISQNWAMLWLGEMNMGQLTDAGIPAAIVAKKIKFNFGISSNYFRNSEIPCGTFALGKYCSFLQSRMCVIARIKVLTENVVAQQKWRFMPKLLLSILLCLMHM